MSSRSRRAERGRQRLLGGRARAAARRATQRPGLAAHESAAASGPPYRRRYAIDALPRLAPAAGPCPARWASVALLQAAKPRGLKASPLAGGTSIGGTNC